MQSNDANFGKFNIYTNSKKLTDFLNSPVETKAMSDVMKFLHMFFVRYSRRIIWLELLTTNNDPGVIVLPYLLAVLRYEGKLLYTCM